jgi:hypothetical protein
MAFTISNNSPSPGYIAWSGLHIQFSGETFIIADGNTDKVYALYRFIRTFTIAGQMRVENENRPWRRQFQRIGRTAVRNRVQSGWQPAMSGSMSATRTNRVRLCHLYFMGNTAAFLQIVRSDPARSRITVYSQGFFQKGGRCRTPRAGGPECWGRIFL